MIDYDAFHNYLVALVSLYQQTHALRGMSQLAARWHCAAITRDQFYQLSLDRLQPTQVTKSLSRVIRDTIGRSEAKATLRESIGALTDGVLAGSRVSQGGDRTVQITLTQPVASAVPQQRKFRVGQIVFRKGGAMHLVSRLLDSQRFTWNYSLTREGDITESAETGADWIDNTDLRPAKGNEVARFLGALTRQGYEWRADNQQGLFTVTPRVRQHVEVFANDLPLDDFGNTGIYLLPSVSPSPYRYVLGPLFPTDNGEDYMTECYDAPMREAVERQIKTAFSGFDHLRELFQYDMPGLCCSPEIKEYRIALVKDDNNGTCYWLARDRDVLRLLSWVAYII